MIVAGPSFSYSTGEVATSEEARQASWEAPVPVNRFWNNFRYCVARNFLGNFMDPELRPLPIVPDSTQDQTTQVRLLLTLLQAKLAEEQSAFSPPQSLYETDYRRWYGLWRAIYVMQDELSLPEAEDTVRMLVNTRPDNPNVVLPHMLAEHVVKIGRYEEAEKVEGLVLALMTARPHLGPSSLQALNARRIITKALWFQGASRRPEAEALLAGFHEIVARMSDGEFGVYQEEERRLNQEMVCRAWSSNMIFQ